MTLVRFNMFLQWGTWKVKILELNEIAFGKVQFTIG